MSTKSLIELETIETELKDVDAQLLSLRQRQQKLREKRDQIRRVIELRASASEAGDSKSWEREDYPWSNRLRNVLKDQFKLNAFRELQLSTINATMTGEHVLLVMSTGGGKSLCYQLPAMIGSGLTLVISPLVALMQDQIRALKSLGIDASALHQNTEKEEVQRVHKALTSAVCSVKLLYVTPEKIAKSKQFMNKLEKVHQLKKLDRIAIDEVHCSSQWGHDFRPDYKFLNILKRQFAGVPILGLTATATAHVIDDVKEILGIPGALVFRATFNRTNLHYSIRSKPNEHKAFVEDVASLINSTFAGQSGIVYCFSRKDTEELSSQLKGHGITSCSYHADLPPQTRANSHDGWITNKYKVIVATIAFGMGIDKSDVRFVIHQTMSKSLENYYQESGRAGRDGNRADCILYYRYADIFKQSTMVCNEQTGTQNLYGMVGYCHTVTRCRRAIVAEHFGEDWEISWCNKMCDLCELNITTENMDVQSCYKQIHAIIKENEVKGKITGPKLLDLWHKIASKEINRKFDRKLCERIVVDLLLEGYLQEDFHFTPYSIISYVTHGPKSVRWLQNNTSIYMHIQGSQGKTEKRKGECPGHKNESGSKKRKNFSDCDKDLIVIN